ncbi:MAG: phosphatase PAP2 family protein [Clostridia bacterium]|nr:phosphatase PAP2 family protein [Clostridia bacterium]
MKPIRKILNFIPQYARKPLLFLLAFNMLAYILPSVLPVEPRFDMTLPIDLKIPAIPVFSYIYVLSYVYWAFNYILICKKNKSMCKRFVTAEVVGKAVCFLIFMLVPCTFARPEADTLSGPGAWLLKIVYALDEPTRLIPSIHCYASWMCVRPLMDKGFDYVPAWYKAFSLVFTLLVCLSTLFTRQHVIVDVFAGVLLGEIVWIASGRMFKDQSKDVAGK